DGGLATLRADGHRGRRYVARAREGRALRAGSARDVCQYERASATTRTIPKIASPRMAIQATAPGPVPSISSAPATISAIAPSALSRIARWRSVRVMYENWFWRHAK